LLLKRIQQFNSKHSEDKTFKIIVVSPLELIRSQQVKKLCGDGIKAVALECCDVKSLETAEIIFGSLCCVRCLGGDTFGKGVMLAIFQGVGTIWCSREQLKMEAMTGAKS